MKQIAPRAFGWRLLQKWLAQQLRQQRGQNVAAGGPAPILVKGLACMALAPGIHQGIAGAAIPAAYRRWLVGRGQHTDIGNAADIEH